LVGSFDPYKPVPDITYNVFGGTLNLALSICPVENALLLMIRWIHFVTNMLREAFSCCWWNRWI